MIREALWREGLLRDRPLSRVEVEGRSSVAEDGQQPVGPLGTVYGVKVWEKGQ